MVQRSARVDLRRGRARADTRKLDAELVRLAGIADNLSSALDSQVGSAVGAMLHRGASAWELKEQVAFSAHKNGSDQSSVAGNDVKVTFGTEEFDVGGYYDAATSKFTPPAGKYLLLAHVRYASTNVTGDTFHVLKFFKDGSEHKVSSGRFFITNAIHSFELVRIVDADGNDEFEVYVSGDAGSKTITGEVIETRFEGFRM